MASSLGDGVSVGGASESRGVVSVSLPLHTTDVKSLTEQLQELIMRYGIRGVGKDSHMIRMYVCSNVCFGVSWLYHCEVS